MLQKSLGDIESELKVLIIKGLNLEGIQASDIDSHEALFVEGLGLDSIDALEIGIILRKEYDIKIETASEEIKAHFRTIRTLAEFIESESNQKNANVG